MTQMVARLDDELAADIDELVESGVVASRSEAIRVGLRRLVDETRRERSGAAVAAGYETLPQTEAEIGWSDAATIEMIAGEPW